MFPPLIGTCRGFLLSALALALPVGRKARAGMPAIECTLVIETTAADVAADRVTFARSVATVQIGRPR